MALPLISVAQAASSVSGSDLSGLPAVTPAGGDIFSTIGSWLPTFLIFVGVIAFVYVIYAGFMYMTAGSGDGAENAKRVLINALIGLMVVALAYAIIRFTIGVINNLDTNANQSGDVAPSKIINSSQ